MTRSVVVPGPRFVRLTAARADDGVQVGVEDELPGPGVQDMVSAGVPPRRFGSRLSTSTVLLAASNMSANMRCLFMATTARSSLGSVKTR